MMKSIILRGRGATLFEIGILYIIKREIPKAINNLSEAYQIFMNMGRLDGICSVGEILGCFLIKSGKKKDGLTILMHSKDGYEKLGQKENAHRVQQFF